MKEKFEKVQMKERFEKVLAIFLKSIIIYTANNIVRCE
jgi:hypothetical protein